MVSVMDSEIDLDAILGRVEKEFGKGSIMRLNGKIEPVAVIPTGALSLDIALGVGGIPRGRITELYGPQGAGKTTLALHIMAEAQRQGLVVAFIDVEHALDPSYCAALGVDMDAIILSQPDSAEQALSIVEVLVRTNQIGCIVVDSVAALIPNAEIAAEIGKPQMGLQARLMSQAMRKLVAPIHKSNCAVLFINQIREKIGVMYGSPETTPGGRALPYHASVRLDVRKGDNIDDGAIHLGVKCKVKIVKNKMAPPLKVVEMDLEYGHGISHEGALMDAAMLYHVIERAGAWMSYGAEKWHGREQVKIALQNDSHLAREIYMKTMEAARLVGDIA